MARIDIAEKHAAREAEAWGVAPAGDSLPIPALPAPRRGATLAAYARAVGRVRERLAGQRIDAAFAEERAHGHFFLFVPVFLGIGAAPARRGWKAGSGRRSRAGATT
ncbi:hypothetical protein [Shinella sp.]|uniref:hypothetical protein n=1 Tax=Shinella sp. TaxID=1870904 RepID=UPI003F6F4E1E